MTSSQVFIQMKKRILARPGQILRVGDVSRVLAEEDREQIESLPVTRFGPEEGNMAVVELMDVVRIIRREYPTLDIRTVGNPQVLIEFKKIVGSLDGSPWLECGYCCLWGRGWPL